MKVEIASFLLIVSSRTFIPTTAAPGEWEYPKARKSPMSVKSSSKLMEADYPDEHRVYRSKKGQLKVTLSLGEALYKSDTLTQKVIGFNGFVGGPTLRVKRGDTVKIHLKNDLPSEYCNTTIPALWNQYHGISETNLHVHGLRIPETSNPNHLRIQAGDSYKYEFKIADDQEGGTHWYHPHSAGSSTLQAGGGGGGLFIVEDEQGDLPDEVLNMPEVPLRIQFFNFTYLQEDYSAFHPSSYVELCKKHCIPAENRYLCSEYFFENGPEEGSYNRTIAPDGLEYETLLVNGVERPTITLSSGQWYRFRTLFVPTRFRTIEPSILDESCDFQLLAKDGHYLPVAPRRIRSGFMTSGSRVDFLVRCHVPGTYEFRSLSESRDSSNWIASQKRNSLDRVMAYINVVGEQKEADAAITQFKPARPCYLPDLTSVTPDHTTYILMSGLNPELPAEEALPEERPAWGSGISYYAINNFGALSPTFLNEKDEDLLDFALELNVGNIWEVDYFVPQIHPWHQHIFPYQVISFPKMDTHNDFFQDGDYHDVLLVPIGGNESEDYGKAVIRTHLDSITGQMLGHCHFYRHTDRGMALVANIVGEDGTRSDNVSKCYSKGGQMTFELV